MNTTTFPSFRSNYPPCLQDLSEYLRGKKSSEEEARSKFGDAAKSATARWTPDGRSYIGRVEAQTRPHSTRPSSAQHRESPRMLDTARSVQFASRGSDRPNSAVSFRSGRNASRQGSAASNRSSRDRTYTPRTVPPIYSYDKFPHLEGGARRQKEFSSRSSSVRGRVSEAALDSVKQNAFSAGFDDIAYTADGGRHKYYVKPSFPVGATDLSAAAGLNESKSDVRPLTSRWWNQRKVPAKKQPKGRAVKQQHEEEEEEEEEGKVGEKEKESWKSNSWRLSQLALEREQRSHAEPLEGEQDFALLENVSIRTRDEMAQVLEGFENVSKLSLRHSSLTDESIGYVPWATPFLREIDLSRTGGYGPEMLSRLLTSLPRLKNVRLERCAWLFREFKSGNKDLSMAVLPSLVTAPKRVHSLSLAHCDTLEDFHILGIAGVKTYNSTLSVKNDADRVDIEQLARAAAGATYRGSALDVIATPGARDVDEDLMSREEYREMMAKKAEERSKKEKEMAEKSTLDTVARELGMERKQDTKEEEEDASEDQLIDSRLYAPLDPSSGKWPCIEEEGVPDTVALSLETLDLTSCKGITDRSLFFLGNTCHELAHISLRLCSQKGLTDRGLWGLCRGTPRLLSMDLTGCSQITSVGVRAIVYSCPLLQELILSGCRKIDDYGPYAITCAPCRVSLRYVDFTRIETITAISVLQMIQSCKALEKVNITLCTTISQGEAYSLGYAAPWVKIIRAADEYYTQDKAPRLVPGFKPIPKSETFDYNAKASMATTAKPKKKTKAKKK
eukprot:gb/GECG01010223.1/.p1 GENE.gb/GECG01010223.1/~~gb/GECG01010223.1/.p1  ORF type:complete len:788 (+),score=99.85 gb/GECG01010223.1/:1-2364(+)